MALRDWLSPFMNWGELARELDGELGERSLLPADAFAASSTGSGPSQLQAPQYSWSLPPQRGLSDALAAYAVSPPFRSVVERVVTSFGCVPWFTGSLDEREFGHPALQLMNAYNPYMVGSDGREYEQAFLDVAGEAITIIAPHPSPKKVNLYPVPPTWVTPETHAGRMKYRVSMGGGDYLFEPEFVFHRRKMNLENPYGRGRGSAEALGDELEADEYISKHAKNYFYNSTKPEFIGLLKGADRKKLKKWSHEWDKQHRGFRQHWRPAWLNEEVEIKELTRQLGEEKIQELRKQIFDIVRYCYGVPPEVVGLVDNSNRATAQEAMQFLGALVTDPRCFKHRQWWQTQIVDELFDGAELLYESPIPRVFDRRDEIMSRHAWAFTRNEIRQEAGYRPTSDGDVYLVPTNHVVQHARRSLAEARDGDLVLTVIEGGRRAG